MARGRSRRGPEDGAMRIILGELIDNALVHATEDHAHGHDDDDA